jgi:hypothetical protein
LWFYHTVFMVFTHKNNVLPHKENTFLLLIYIKNSFIIHLQLVLNHLNFIK